MQEKSWERKGTHFVVSHTGSPKGPILIRVTYPVTA